MFGTNVKMHGMNENMFGMNGGYKQYLKLKKWKKCACPDRVSSYTVLPNSYLLYAAIVNYGHNNPA